MLVIRASVKEEASNICKQQHFDLLHSLSLLMDFLSTESDIFSVIIEHNYSEEKTLKQFTIIFTHFVTIKRDQVT